MQGATVEGMNKFGAVGLISHDSTGGCLGKGIGAFVERIPCVCRDMPKLDGVTSLSRNCLKCREALGMAGQHVCSATKHSNASCRLAVKGDGRSAAITTCHNGEGEGHSIHFGSGRPKGRP